MSYRRFSASYFVLLLLLSIGWLPLEGAFLGNRSHPVFSDELHACDPLGWFPDAFGLKDHTVFSYEGSYYIVATYLGDDAYEDQFAYAVSSDLCHWQDLGGILKDRPPGGWDEYRIWAPYVFQEGGIYYMYYTGVTHAFAQSIMLATSTNPVDPSSWQRQGVVFQPSHPGSVWGGFSTWSDCRDPTVVKVDALYYLYYTGLDVSGGIVGLATAPSPLGPWVDWGAVVTTPDTMPESPTVVSYGELYYLFYNEVAQGGEREVYSYGPAPGGPWKGPSPFHDGWGHEIWIGLADEFYTSYLTDHAITIQRLVWDDAYDPPRPFVGESIYSVLMPIIVK
jgi:predicted GH43/DUF377 family glycosyl hydrolase